MKSPGIESVGKQLVIEEQLTGREAISTEKAMVTQIDLAYRLAPKEIRQLIYKDEEGNTVECLTPELIEQIQSNPNQARQILNDLVALYASKYTNSNFDGFEIFCNEKADAAFIERINQGSLTTDDYENMKHFLEENSGKFFAEGEVEAFIAQYNF